MDLLNIKETKSSPSVVFIPDKRVLEIKGYSYPQDPATFYKPVIVWLKKYLTKSRKKLICNFHLIFLNTSSSKFVLNIIHLLETHSTGGGVINWYHHKDNETAYDCGHFFKESTNILFNIISMDDGDEL